MKAWILILLALLLAAPAGAQEVPTYQAEAASGTFQLLRKGQWSQPKGKQDLQLGDLLKVQPASLVKVSSATGEGLTLGGNSIAWVQNWKTNQGSGSLTLIYGKAKIAAEKGQTYVATALGLVRVSPLAEASIALSQKTLVAAFVKGRATLIAPSGQQQDLNSKQVGLLAGRVRSALGSGELFDWKPEDFEAPPRNLQQGVSLVKEEPMTQLGLLDAEALRQGEESAQAAWLVYQSHEQFAPQAMQAQVGLTEVIWVDDTQDLIERDPFDLTIRKPGEVAKVTVTFEK